MEFKKLALPLQRFTVVCTLLGMACLLALSTCHRPDISPAVIMTAVFLALLFALAKKFQVLLEAHIVLNSLTVIVTSAFFISGPWILLPLVISGLITDLMKREKAWIIILNASSDAIRIVPGFYLFMISGGEFAFKHLTASVVISSSAFFLWLIASDFALILLFTATCSGEKLSFKKLDLVTPGIELFFFPFSLLAVLTMTTMGLPYLLLIAVPLAGVFYLYRFGLGKKAELLELTRLNRELASLSAERAALLAESERRTAELKRVHAHLLQAEKLASIGKLAAGLAHELNTPLGTVLTNAEFALSFADDKDMEESLHMIRRGALRCRNITESLLAYSRKEEMKLTTFPLGRALEETLAELEPLIRNAAITIEHEGDPAIELHGIYDSFLQISGNIIKNSIDAIAAKNEGKGIISISWSVKENRVLLSIKDNGAGMSKEVMERIFDPFFTTKDVGKGTGLGLWLARNLMEMHRGKISVRSMAGEGTEFVLEIPGQGAEMQQKGTDETNTGNR